MDAWFWFWVGLAAVLIVAEVFTATFFMLAFGLGAAVAAVLSYADATPTTQWSVFLGVSVPLLLIAWLLSRRSRSDQPQPVGGNRLIGAAGLVIETIRPHGQSGMVRVGSEEWRAVTQDDGEIESGAQVKVVRVDGVSLVVTQAN